MRTTSNGFLYDIARSLQHPALTETLSAANANTQVANANRGSRAGGRAKPARDRPHHACSSVLGPKPRHQPRISTAPRYPLPSPVAQVVFEVLRVPGPLVSWMTEIWRPGMGARTWPGRWTTGKELFFSSSSFCAPRHWHGRLEGQKVQYVA
jgi:hypothetical protein